MSIAIKKQGIGRVPPIRDIEKIDFCFCGIDCLDNYIEKAFVSDDLDAWKNDKSSFIFRKIRDADTIQIQIWKGVVKQADISNNDYGTYYPSFATNSLYVGLIVDWKSVFNAFGYGIYTIRADRQILGQSKPFTSRTFQVLPYSDDLADRTARIETYTSGNILRNDINLSGLVEGGWYQSVRLNGRFGNQSEVYVEDQYLDSSRSIVDIQPSIENEYILFTEYLPENIRSLLVNGGLLANRILITDYNLLNDGTYRQLEVSFNDFGSIAHQGRGTAYQLSFKDRKNDLVIIN